MQTVKHDAERVHFWLAPGDHFQLCCLTGLPRPGVPAREAAGALFDAVAAAVVEHGIEPVDEKVYGRVEARRDILASRRRAFAAVGLDSSLPCSFHQGIPIERDDLAGVQLWGVVPAGSEISVTTAGGGRLWRGHDYRVLCLPGIDGLAGNGAAVPCPTEQARRMFTVAAQTLEGQALRFHNVARTWIYLKHILERYDEFNIVRSAFFTEQGIGDGPEHNFPASTGIQGTTAGEECAMDLLAVDGPGAVRTPLHVSSRQNAAWEYGSAFSRGMSLRIGGLETIFVSGTASIDRSGATVYLDDPEAQIVETLKCIAALLASCGRSLDDIRLATLFCKTPSILEAWREVTRLLRIPALPVVPVVADVCRPDLLVEIEAMAVVPSGREGSP